MVDTFRFYFDLDVAKLSKNIERKIDLLIYNDRIINGSEIRVIGYTDYLGSERYNKNLSVERAKNIKKYLVKYGIDAASVKLVTGKGEIRRRDTGSTDGSPDDRRVDIVVNNRVYTADRLQRPNRIALAELNKQKKAGKDEKKELKTIGGSGSKPQPAEPDLTKIAELKKGDAIRLKNVYFGAGSHIIREESFPTLEKLFATLQRNPQIKIKIEGHVCCIHDVADAMDIDTNEPRLSVNRARAIYQYLIDKGIDEGRLQYEGFGKRKPVVLNERTEEDAEMNRRVEIRVLGD
jgi:outer membrane protein OmpA-like peptidoglycan-associated protein